MKTYLILFVMCLSFLTINVYGQTQTTPEPEKITVNVTDLTVDQLAKIKMKQQADELNTKIMTYGKWAGVGKEVGSAIREGLTAVVDVSEKFGGTKIGTFTMYMIAWKVIGQDLVRIFLGILGLMVVCTMIFYSFRRLYPRRIRTKGSLFRFWEPKEYIVTKVEDFEGIEVLKILHLLMFVGAFGLSYAIMFA